MRDDLIYRNALLDELVEGGILPAMVRRTIERVSAVDAVPAEKYDELREAFVDYVCSGVVNPAPYCKNRCAECVDSRGWCTYRRCAGFNPDGE